ncbi:hypothetical protein M422DRAFT_110997, partial [Sphaerobolus stellatus SS14]
QTRWEQMRDERLAGCKDRWGGFQTEEQWELARWMMKSGLSHGEIDKLLKLKIRPTLMHPMQTKNKTRPAFHNKRAFFKLIDELPTSRIPDFECKIIDVEGTQLDENGKPRIEHLELWQRNPLDCIREIIGNPALQDHISYSPVKIFSDDTCNEQIFNEM